MWTPEMRAKYAGKAKPVRKVKQRQYARASYRKNRAARIRYSKIRQLAQLGFSIEHYENLCKEGCAICGDKDTKLCGDHDHANGKPRAVLCHRCNSGIGLLKDNPDICRAAAAYIELWRSKHAL